MSRQLPPRHAVPAQGLWAWDMEQRALHYLHFGRGEFLRGLFRCFRDTGASERNRKNRKSGGLTR